MEGHKEGIGGGVEEYLKGLKFPARKREIIDYAERKNATDDTLEVLNDFEDREYENLGDVLLEFGSKGKAA